MNKHAYLILAHNSIENLKFLIKSIDDERNDIYVHLDKKWKDVNESVVLAAIGETKSAIYFSERTKITWGGYSQIVGELTLMQTAVDKAQAYSYYHLVSSCDMAIKSQNQIHRFFDENKGKEFLAFCGDDWNVDNYYKLRYHHIERGRNKFLQIVNKVSVTIQKLLRVDRLRNIDVEIVGGANWASMTYDFVKFLLDSKGTIKKIFKNSFCADEFYKHTMAYNSCFREKLYLLNKAEKNEVSKLTMGQANKRHIDWVRGNPYTFGLSDINELIQSDCLFARKFNYDSDGKVQQKLISILKNENIDGQCSSSV